jgi:hypothetical protein
MSYEVNQYFGWGLKVSDIANYTSEDEHTIYPEFLDYPLEVCNKLTVDLDLIKKHKMLKSDLMLLNNDGDLEINVKSCLIVLLAKRIKCPDIEREEIESIIHLVFEQYLVIESDDFPGMGCDFGTVDGHLVNYGIESTNYGGVHQLGGMIMDEPYLFYGGGVDELEEDGSWDNPMEKPASVEVMETLKNRLVGKDHKGFELLKPIFGC